MAESAPRLLVPADGWRVERLDELDVDRGEITWATGDPTEVTATSLDAGGRVAMHETTGPDVRELTIAWTSDDGDAEAVGFDPGRTMGNTRAGRCSRSAI